MRTITKIRLSGLVIWLVLWLGLTINSQNGGTDWTRLLACGILPALLATAIWRFDTAKFAKEEHIQTQLADFLEEPVSPESNEVDPMLLTPDTDLYFESKIYYREPSRGILQGNKLKSFFDTATPFPGTLIVYDDEIVLEGIANGAWQKGGFFMGLFAALIGMVVGANTDEIIGQWVIFGFIIGVLISQVRKTERVVLYSEVNRVLAVARNEYFSAFANTLAQWFSKILDKILGLLLSRYSKKGEVSRIAGEVIHIFQRNTRNQYQVYCFELADINNLDDFWSTLSKRISPERLIRPNVNT